ncbi:hypothetical protein F5Y04DRAFT_289039 [Hypomontagnella monticulosa]|nr:hypothetical protein F5Y04DRAFT_289039 [Hypomontagnella monticulosa]
MASPQSASNGNGLKIINASLFRMSTMSMAQAYIILGYKTHHGLLEGVMDTPWNTLEKAAEATWPTVPGAPSTPRPPFTRADWDELWGSYDAVTDIACPFSLELIKAYPEAKVVVVQRAFETWWPSFRTQVRDAVMKEPVASIQGFISSMFLGIRPVQAMSKALLGMCGARTLHEINEARARVVYEEYFRQVRELVPPERRLEYKIGSGWGPLCAFLGVPVPDVPFPRANERSANNKEVVARHLVILKNGAKAVAPWVFGLVAVGMACWWYRQDGMAIGYGWTVWVP